MFSSTVKLNDLYTVKGAAGESGAPISVAAAGTLASGWIPMTDPRIELLCMMGVGAGTSALTWQQATDASGTSAKALELGDFATGGSAIISFAGDDDGKVKLASGRAEFLDRAGGFTHVQATLTVTGGAGTLLAMAVLTGPRRY